jgi:hypothetical protein
MTNKAELSRFLFQDEAPERDFGQILSVSGPVVIAEKMTGAAMYELVSVPRRGLVLLQSFFFFFFFFTRDVTGACGHVWPRWRDHSSRRRHSDDSDIRRNVYVAQFRGFHAVWPKKRDVLTFFFFFFFDFFFFFCVFVEPRDVVM